MPIIAIIDSAEDSSEVQWLAASLARRTGQALLVVEATSTLVELTERFSGLTPRLIVLGGSIAACTPDGAGDPRSALHQLVSTPGVPVLVVASGSALTEAVDGRGYPRVVVALEQGANEGAPVLREARAFRAAIPCNFTLLCASADTPPLADTLAIMACNRAYDLAIMSARTWTSLRSNNPARERSTLVVGGIWTSPERRRQPRPASDMPEHQLSDEDKS